MRQSTRMNGYPLTFAILILIITAPLAAAIAPNGSGPFVQIDSDNLLVELSFGGTQTWIQIPHGQAATIQNHRTGEVIRLEPELLLSVDGDISVKITEYLHLADSMAEATPQRNSSLILQHDRAQSYRSLGQINLGLSLASESRMLREVSCPSMLSDDLIGPFRDILSAAKCCISCGPITTCSCAVYTDCGNCCMNPCCGVVIE